MLEERHTCGDDGGNQLGWLNLFHGGDRSTLEEIYWRHFAHVEAAVAPILGGVDRETVVYDVFWRLLHQESFRRTFQGGDLRAWLMAMASQRAADYLRQRQKGSPPRLDPAISASVGLSEGAKSVEGDPLIERFLRDLLPADWQDVFRARFIARMTLAETATAVGRSRGAVIYQELRIRRILRRFLLENGASSGPE